MYCCDSHVHTHFSFDGSPTATVDAICRAALRRGVAEITITDHCDINGEVEAIYAHYAMEAARDEVIAAREAYAGQLIVNWGIELGQPYQYPREAAALIAAGQFDFVLGSLHNLTDVPDFSFLRYDEMPDALINRLFARAIDESMQVACFPGVHSLGHLTYPLRYVAMSGRSFDLSPHIPAIARLFAQMIANDTALEVNFSTWRSGQGFAMPDEALLRLYRSCGGERITLGSDAHRPEDVAVGLEDAIALLRRCGFDQVFTYRGGQPYAHPLGERKD